MAHSWRHICAPSLAAAAVKNALILSVQRIGWNSGPLTVEWKVTDLRGAQGLLVDLPLTQFSSLPLLALVSFLLCWYSSVTSCRKKPSLAFLVCQQAQGQGVGSSLLALSGNHRRKSAEVSIAGSLRWRLNLGSPWHSAGLKLKCEHGSLWCVSPTPLQRWCPAAPCMNLSRIPRSPRSDVVIRLNDFISRNLEAAFTYE